MVGDGLKKITIYHADQAYTWFLHRQNDAEYICTSVYKATTEKLFCKSGLFRGVIIKWQRNRKSCRSRTYTHISVMNFLTLQLKFKYNLSLTTYAVAILFDLSFSVSQIKNISCRSRNYIYLLNDIKVKVFRWSLFKHIYYTHPIFHCMYLSLDRID